MDRRLELQELLEEALGSKNVYFQPPESVKMTYPCIVYTVRDIPTTHADDLPYFVREMYDVTVITRNPDSELPKKLAKAKGFAYDRYYAADNLHHHALRYTVL